MRGISRNLVCVLVTVSAITPLFAAPHLLPVAGEEQDVEVQPGSPVCEEFFDQWEVAGVPAAMLAMGGIGRELMAANDCIHKNEAATACKHWRKVLEVTDKMGPPFDQNRVGIEELMYEHQCDPSAEQTDPGEARESSE